MFVLAVVYKKYTHHNNRSGGSKEWDALAIQLHTSVGLNV